MKMLITKEVLWTTQVSISVVHSISISTNNITYIMVKGMGQKNAQL